jgi:radical SAM family uncharacterized protein/radical SAM-linked protein
MPETFRERLEREILPYVDKPARYTGGEVNAVTKDPAGKTRVALVFPDAYEIGSSNVGLKILYSMLNARDDVFCERAFAPWADMEALLREKTIPLFSLETATPLGEFDILGFSFQYELLFTNFLNVLDLAGLPLRSKDRAEDHPIVIGGGPVTTNSEPVAPFLDAVGIGDGETLLARMTDVVRDGRAAKKSRAAILRALSEVDGVYVPSLYTVEKEGGWQIPKGKPVRRAMESDLDVLPFVTKQVVPNVQAVQDRAVIEVTRGCTRGCRFCQAGMIYRPVRERSVETILALGREAVRNTGYHEFSLISLSISDYGDLPGLIDALDRQFTARGVSFSLPSLRLDSFTIDLAKKVQEIRRSGLTFAVEGGSQSIRDAINKGVNGEDLFRVIRTAKDLGWKSVKLYFMIGLPNEDGEDEAANIAELACRVTREVRGINVTVSVAVFIPKAHTPYQWMGQMTPERGKSEIHRIIQTVKERRAPVNVRYNDPFVSWLEGVFSRGDRRLADAVELAFRKGARFDGWSEHLNLERWRQSFAECGIDPEFYLSPKSEGSAMPWDVIDCGFTRDFLLSELARSKAKSFTPDCREGCTNGCGCCDFEETMPRPAAKAVPVTIDESFLANVRHEAPSVVSARFRFTKLGSAKYLSQIDLEEHFSRAFLRADLPIGFTQGFNPHPRIEMSWALPIGFGSEWEACQVELTSPWTSEQFEAALNATLPDGLRVTRSEVHPWPYPKLSKSAYTQAVEFSLEHPATEEEIRSAIASSRSFRKVTPKGETVIDMSNYVLSAKKENDRVRITYIQREGGARIQDVVAALLGIDIREASARRPMVHRRFVENEGKWTELLGNKTLGEE